ncbi:MAG: response regulator, partial [Desulfosudaceae bacterium]
LEAADQQTFDVFFVDFRLPGATGLELLRSLQEKAHHQPFIILTGQGDQTIDIQAMEEGVADYLEKDQLSSSLLERVIRYALARANTWNALKRSEKSLRILSEKLIQAQEQERTRLARELHDSTSANLTAIKYAIEKKLYEKGDQGDDSEAAYFRYLIGLIQETSQDIQRIYSDLRPAVLDDLGVLAAAERLCRQFDEIHPEIGVATEFVIDEADVPQQLKIVIYRILQEALNNIARHSRADQVHLFMEQTDDDGLRLVVSDNGRGFEAKAFLRAESENLSGGFGLMNMKERVVFSGGRFAIDSAPGRGTNLDIVWPRSFPAEQVADESA